MPVARSVAIVEMVPLISGVQIITNIPCWTLMARRTSGGRRSNEPRTEVELVRSSFYTTGPQMSCSGAVHAMHMRQRLLSNADKEASRPTPLRARACSRASQPICGTFLRRHFDVRFGGVVPLRLIRGKCDSHAEDVVITQGRGAQNTRTQHG